MYKHFASVHVCMYVYFVCLEPKEARRGGVPEIRVTDGLQAHVDARNQIQALSRADSALNHQAKSWAPEQNP